MAKNVLILQPDRRSAQILATYFRKSAGKIFHTINSAQAIASLDKFTPGLVFVDLHMPNNESIDFLIRLKEKAPAAGVIVTNRTPNVHLEMLAKEQGVRVFLREPLTPKWITHALNQLYSKSTHGKRPVKKPKPTKVRFPMRIKITVPFTLLALIFALAAVYLGSRYVLESIQERFTNQLIDAGKLSSDSMVQIENSLLETLRLLSYTEGVAEAINAGDADQLRRIALPVAINAQEDSVEFLDLTGVSVLSLQHIPDGKLEDYTATHGDPTPANWDFVQKVLYQEVDDRGDKYAGLVRETGRDVFYIAGPVYDSQEKLTGAVLIGKSVENLARQIREDTLAQITLYDISGRLMATTTLVQQDIPPVPPATSIDVLLNQDIGSHTRNLSVASINYSEILGPWEARGGEDLGAIGVALAQNFLVRPSNFTSFQASFVVAIIFISVIGIGFVLARQVTSPLTRIVKAFAKVTNGDLEVKVPPVGNDEFTVLAHAFNYMVSGLQEGFIYRDLLGRTVSPEIREALRKSFATGIVRLEGQSALATVLMSDIRSFTSISENEDPTTILKWLNEYFGELVPVITSHGGVVDKFEGDAMLAFFGILPTPISLDESAYHACRAAIEMLEVINRINARRAERSEPPLITGIGINSGPLTAGGLGTSDRLNYTIIGDTVNTTQRLQEITRELGDSGVIISEFTRAVLKDRENEFKFESLGYHTFKGKKESLELYQLRLAERAESEA
jgi:class 3 adenylate cyclase/HAMP domain-containing protein/CheY-like chemotaxis protein